MRLQFFIPFIFIFTVSTKSVGQKSDFQQTFDSQFEITIKMHSPIQQTRTKIFFNNHFIKVLKNEEITKTNNDPIIFSVELTNIDTLNFMDKIQRDSLPFYYSNPCVDDGFTLEILLLKDHKTKQIILKNYYQNDVGKIISFINARLPVDYRIEYEKDKLVASQKRCDDILLKEKH
jgi:hypothetical protein